MTLDLTFQAGDPLAESADALIVGVVTSDRDLDLTRLGDRTNEQLAGELARLASEAHFVGSIDSTLVVPTLGKTAARRVVLTGIGSIDRLDANAVRRAWGAAASAARRAGAATTVSAVPPNGANLTGDQALQAAAEGVELALYRFTKHHGTVRGQGDTGKQLRSFRFVGESNDGHPNQALQQASLYARATNLARDLVNEPASVLTPATMAERAQQVANNNGLECEILDAGQLAEMGAGALVAVGQGSKNKPCLIRLRYRPTVDAAGTASNDETPHNADRLIGLVGKCITFDTGGYSIKTYDGMLNMKGDMAGGAAVLGAMSVLRDLDCPYRVDATICAAENMISGDAFRPGDVLTALNGVTIEVLSTDAEGRLVLADGLVDAARQGATELIDLATLTGAAVVALGDETSALFASDERLANDLLTASTNAGESTWRLPLTESMNSRIKGNIADIKNTGGRAGGAIIGALVLQHFTEGLPWAHFDIAGPALTTKSGPLGPKGASGVGVRTLLTYLMT